MEENPAPPRSTERPQTKSTPTNTSDELKCGERKQESADISNMTAPGASVHVTTEDVGATAHVEGNDRVAPPKRRRSSKDDEEARQKRSKARRLVTTEARLRADKSNKRENVRCISCENHAL